MKLLDRVQNEQYIAFCDQDDRWETFHLSEAIASLNNYSVLQPALYFPRYSYIDSNSKNVGIRKSGSKVGIRNALVENQATGCGIVLNRPAFDTLEKIPFSPTLYLDHQLYYVFSMIGKVIQGSTASVNYRVHENNMVGIRKHDFKSIQKIIKDIQNKKYIEQRIHFENQFSHLKNMFVIQEQEELVAYFNSARSDLFARLRYSLNPWFVRENKIDQLLFRILFVLGDL